MNNVNRNTQPRLGIDVYPLFFIETVKKNSISDDHEARKNCVHMLVYETRFFSVSE